MAAKGTLVTSGSCRPSRDRPAVACGFTLLELLVVLALAAMATGLVVPALLRSVAAAQARGARADLAQALRDLPVQAFQHGQALSVDEASLRHAMPNWPDGWRMQLDQPLRYGPTGVAEGGVLRVLPSDRPPYTLRVVPLTGELQADDGSGG